MVKKDFRPILQRIYADPVYFAQNPALQRRGVDGKLIAELGDYDVKIRDAKYRGCGDIALETISVEETGKKGWLFNETPLVVYLWWYNASHINFQDGYIIKLEQTRNWWVRENGEDRFSQLPNVSSNNGAWHTINYAVPIKTLKICNLIIHLDCTSPFFRPEDQPIIDKWFHKTPPKEVKVVTSKRGQSQLSFNKSIKLPPPDGV